MLQQTNIRNCRYEITSSLSSILTLHPYQVNSIISLKVCRMSINFLLRYYQSVRDDIFHLCLSASIIMLSNTICNSFIYSSEIELYTQVEDYPSLLFYPANDKSNPVHAIFLHHQTFDFLYSKTWILTSDFLIRRLSSRQSPTWRNWQQLSTKIWKLKIPYPRMNCDQ